MKKNNTHGFTLAELLIVVAIIAVLTAIAIPVFSTQLEKSREGVDAANIRSAYAEVQSAKLGTDNEYYKTVTIKQKTGGWLTTVDWPENLDVDEASPVNTGTYYVYTTSDGRAHFDDSAGTGTLNVTTIGAAAPAEDQPDD